jgi:hypothetical protein
MMIEITEKTYSRLSLLVQGFDTPDAVINRLIDNYTNQPEKKPTIQFIPEDERVFKSNLLATNIAEVCLYYDNGTRLVLTWNAKKLNENSNLRGNIWSGFLRGWKAKKIVRAKFETLRVNQNIPELKLAHALNLTCKEAAIVKPITHREDKDTYLVSFENEDMSILNKITGHKLNSDLNIYLPSILLELEN